MNGNKRASTLGGLVQEVVATADRAEREKLTSTSDIENDLDAVIERDYARQLKGYFSQRELTGILAAFTESLPTLNREVFRGTELQRFARIAFRLGARLEARSFAEPDGLGLRGFYINDPKSLKRPLICVNTAQPKVAVASAFWHEVGHHLTSQIVEEYPEPVNLSLDNDYEKHLDDPLEVIADIVVALGGYTRPSVQRLFAHSLRKELPPDAREFVLKATAHLRSVSGWKFEKRYPLLQNLKYLAGMIHFAKLRWTLISEYQI